MTAQLTLDGREVERPPQAEGLSTAQRAVTAHLAEHGQIRTVEAGVILHAHRGGCAKGGRRWEGFEGKGAACCPYAAPDGLELLRRLMARGLVERTEARGVWVAR